MSDIVRAAALDEHREKWVHEDDLISQRLQWYGVSQALLFAAYGLSFQVNQSELQKSREAQQLFLRFIDAVPVVGVLLSLIIFAGVFAACLAMLILHFRHNRALPKSERRAPGVSWVTTILGMSTGLLIPILFFWLWSHVLLDLSSFWPWDMRLWFQHAHLLLQLNNSRRVRLISDRRV